MFPAFNDGLLWFKSSRSAGNGACVEVAFVSSSAVAMRDSKDPRGPVLRFSAGSWQRFVADVRTGEIDQPRS
ncbi:DUF397 domain-containing protein [Phytohabitans suffuscus]|uniref:DUF397 domain-containing protein n=1 Tax=Phytohabitans suffuscus TaxID=624315 RepID=A0A6F8YGH3_9ACTN|nr:DUF397 domain-containing protein [Phytohabitans suffuscus]BCB85041.1 DUF397 domain-containing protein [Phytohabitans suffuscus]